MYIYINLLSVNGGITRERPATDSDRPRRFGETRKCGVRSVRADIQRRPILTELAGPVSSRIFQNFRIFRGPHSEQCDYGILYIWRFVFICFYFLIISEIYLMHIVNAIFGIL